MKKFWLKKLIITNKDSYDQRIQESIDLALTEFRKNAEFSKGRDDGGNVEWFEDPAYFALENMKGKIDFKVAIPSKFLKDIKVSEAVKQIIETSFNFNPLSLREQEPGDLFAMQDAAVAKYFTDPHARNIANNIQYYTVGSGVQFRVPDKEVQEVIRNFRQLNKVDKRCKSMVLMTYLEGEYPLALFIGKKGNLLLRRIAPKEITEVETHPEDTENIFAFHQQVSLLAGKELDRWIPSVDYRKWEESQFDSYLSAHRNEFTDNLVLQFIKYGIEGETRGRVPMQSIMKYLKYYEDFVVDRIRLNHERSKVVWIKEVKGRSSEAITKERKSPRGGIMLIENENVKYRTESSKLESGDAEKDALLILYTIASGVNIPIYILDQRSDQQNYSSIKKSDTPFSQMIMDNQDFWYVEWEMILRTLLQAKVGAKELKDITKVKSYLIESQVDAARAINLAVIEGRPKLDIIKEAEKILKDGEKEENINTVNIPIDIIFPDVIQEDALQQAQVLQIHHTIGIASRATLSTKAGYNWPMEIAAQKIEQQELIPPETGTQDGRAVKPRQPVPKTNPNKNEPIPKDGKATTRLNR